MLLPNESSNFRTSKHSVSPKICLNKPMHTGTDFDTNGPVTKEIKICTNATINVKTTVYLHNTYYGNAYLDCKIV